MLQKTEINKGWYFKQASSLNDGAASSFIPTSQFPTVAHIDLLHHKLIPDPYIDNNELACLWVNDADWTYRTEQVGPVTLAASERAVLVFEGLDTVVDVYLNDEHILFSKNMHTSHRIDVTHILRGSPGPVALELRFQAAPAFARRERDRIGYKGDGSQIHFGGSERLFLRKAQYHWGWDWGPAVNTSGPWKPIYLETFVSRIGDFLVHQEVAADVQAALVSITGSVENNEQGQNLELEIFDPSGTSILSESLAISSNGIFEGKLKLKNPQLWYPFTYGAQPLYSIKANLGGRHTRTQSLGLRRLRLLQHPLKYAEGTSFLFEINNVRIFCGGANWIPGDFMLPRMTIQRYEDWLGLAKSGNQSMIRVWGGGIMEDNAFYDICDREGILVWQDFLFACGNYPASNDFIDEVRNEAEQQVKRIGYHPSLVIWAGNNEDYMMADRYGWEWDIDDQKGPWDKTNFPAREIYERVLPQVIEKLGGDVPYWRSSPYGGSTANDSTVGDVHIWDVWHGQMSPYQDYKKYASRFVSEFGFESAPDLRTLHNAITDPRERQSQSRTFDVHDKGPGHERRYAMYMGENFRFRMNPLRDFVYCTQFLQAEAMKYAYNCWRREFRGPGEENCSGVLVWQLNDIWPGTSWALVDVDLHRKPAFYITKRALAPVVVGMERIVTKEPPYQIFNGLPEKAALELWAVNGLLEELKATLKLSAFDIKTGKEIPLPVPAAKLTLKPNQTTEISRIDIPHADTTVVVAYLDDTETSERLARWVSWPEPLKFLQFSPELKVTVRIEVDTVFLSTNCPAKGVVVSVPIEEGEDAVFDDNFIDLVPDEEVKIHVKGLDGRGMQTRFLCDWELEKGFEL